MKKHLMKIVVFLLMTAMSIGLMAPAFAASVTDFTDVPSGIWYYDYVRIACDNSLLSGTSASTFSPNGTMTRGQFVTLLGRFAKVNSASVVNTGKFSDVPANEYYTPYIYWASAKGIVNGLTDITFGANENITKEQMATLLVRYATSERISIPNVESKPDFKDNKAISDYAYSAVNKLKNANIISGDESYNFHPQKAISRAEATTLFVKFALAIDVIQDKSNVIDCTHIYATLLNDDGYSTSEMYVGDSKQISVMYVPENTTIDKTCTYVSGDTSIATVDDNGTVTAVAVGSTYVTVTASNGLTDICSIKVKSRNAQITGFELAWGNKWEIKTYSGGYYCYDWTVMGETSTVTRDIGEDSGYLLLSPKIVYSDGSGKIILPESYGAYKFTFTSSDTSAAQRILCK